MRLVWVLTARIGRMTLWHWNSVVVIMIIIIIIIIIIMIVIWLLLVLLLLLYDVFACNWVMFRGSDPKAESIPRNPSTSKFESNLWNAAQRKYAVHKKQNTLYVKTLTQTPNQLHSHPRLRFIHLHQLFRIQ